MASEYIGSVVLAMYDIRAKQEFIFRTNKLKEIAGGSWIIRDCFEDYLYPAAKEISDKGIFSYKREEEAFFSKKAFEKHMKEGYIGEVVYEGGGNFLILFRNQQIFRDVTYKFTSEVMKNVGTLRILGTCITTVDFSDYPKNQKELYAKHRRNEMEESGIAPWACLPIALVDRKTSLPIVQRTTTGEYSKENKAKREKYENVVKKIRKEDSEAARYFIRNTNTLDELVKKKGEDSQIAVVYIDGNNMGAKVQKATENLRSYEECVNRLREFSEEIQMEYVEEGIKNALEIENDRKHRLVVYAGDEINFIVNAHDALDCAKQYLDGLKKDDDASACAGIAVFNSHAPYADACRIAEEACESGKQKMKELKLNCASFIDFHVCQGAIDRSLEAIRKEETGEIISRPWLYWSKDDVTRMDIARFDEFVSNPEKGIVGFMNEAGRSNMKGLGTAAHEGSSALELELMRIYSHMSEGKKERNKAYWEYLQSMDPLKKRQLIYDAVIAYDLWFNEKEDD